MAGTRKSQSTDRVAGAVRQFLESCELRGRRVAVGLSGGLDSTVLLQVLAEAAAAHGFSLRAVHVHHGLSPNAGAWARFCRALCRRLGVPLSVRKVAVIAKGGGLEAAAREARYGAYRGVRADALALAHQLDDQAETVLMNLLRGAGRRGASGMPARALLQDGKLLLRPLLEVPRAAIRAYAESRALDWIEDESNADMARTRNFIRLRVAPVLEERFPRWREALSRAARHFSASEADSRLLLREYLAGQGLRAPSETKLVEMLKQLTAQGARTTLEHDGARLKLYRGALHRETAPSATAFSSLPWSGERRIAIPALRGEVRFRPARGKGIDLKRVDRGAWILRLRAGGERLQTDARRPRRTLKNLFQEAGIAPWRRERLPLLYCGQDLVWVPGLGIAASYQAAGQAPGLVPEWRDLA
jgi:tRNA(Ile)-lysidine synthase